MSQKKKGRKIKVLDSTVENSCYGLSIAQLSRTLM